MKWTALFCLCFFSTAWGQQQNPILWLGAEGANAAASVDEAENENQPIQIPFEVHGGLLMVGGTMNGQSGRFIFDTGSPSLLINQPIKGGVEETLSFGFNEVTTLQKIKIKSFAWATQKARSIDAYALNLEHLETITNQEIMGVIGFDGLQSYEVRFDFEGNELHLRPGGQAYPNQAQMLKASFQLAGHLPIIILKINGKKYRFGLDTGASVNVIDHKAAKALKEFINELPQTALLGGIGNQSIKAQKVSVSGFQLQDHVFNPIPFCVADLAPLRSATDMPIDGLLGLPFFKAFPFSIDFDKQMIYFLMP